MTALADEGFLARFEAGNLDNLIGSGPCAAAPRVPLVLTPAWGPEAWPEAPSRRCASQGPRRIRFSGA